MTESNRKAKGLSSLAPQNDSGENVARTMSSREIAKLTGKRHDHVMRDIRNMLTELKITDPSFGGSYLDGSGRLLPCFNLDRELTETLVTGYSIPLRHKVIRRLRELEEQAVTPLKKINGAKVNGEIAIFECFTRLLKPSASSQMLMLSKIAANNGLESTFLPSYAIDAAPDATGGGSMPTKALTALIKDHCLPTTAATFNHSLAAAGFLKTMQRKNSRQQTVHFWSITEKGLRYGKNLTSPQSPRETQPHWYVDRFLELADLIGKGRP
jgi:phage regulator Rha-like protein